MKRKKGDHRGSGIKYVSYALAKAGPRWEARCPGFAKAVCVNRKRTDEQALQCAVDCLVRHLEGEIRVTAVPSHGMSDVPLAPGWWKPASWGEPRPKIGYVSPILLRGEDERPGDRRGCSVKYIYFNKGTGAWVALARNRRRVLFLQSFTVGTKYTDEQAPSFALGALVQYYEGKPSAPRPYKPSSPASSPARLHMG